MVDIALINPRTEFIKKKSTDSKGGRNNAIYKDNELKFQEEYIREPPTGLMILAAVLEREGYSVDIIDCSIIKSPFDYLRENSKKYRLFGFTSLTNTFSITIQLAKMAKRYNPDSYIVMGGPHVSFEFQSVLKKNPYIDAICVGESEKSFPWLVQKMLKAPSIDLVYEGKSINNKEYKNCPGKIQYILNSEESIPKGICFLSNPIIDSFQLGLKDYTSNLGDKSDKLDSYGNYIMPSVVYSGFPDSLDLSRIPFPARHLISMNYSVADVIVNRGCPNKCSFCSRTHLFPRMRIRKIDKIMEEVNQILEYSNYKFINFYDNININPKFFNEFLNRLIDRKIPIPWGSELRVDTITTEQAKLMKKSNCRIIATGVESADEHVLKTNFKFQDPKKVAEGIKILKEAQIAIQAYFVIGLPGETEKSFQKTLNFLKNLPLKSGLDRVEFFVATPYPGSDLALRKEFYGINIRKVHYNQYNCREIIMETSTLDYHQIKEMVSEAKHIKEDLGY